MLNENMSAAVFYLSSMLHAPEDLRHNLSPEPPSITYNAVQALLGLARSLFSHPAGDEWSSFSHHGLILTNQVSLEFTNTST